MLIELALVVPVLAILAMGIVDFGTLFSERIALRTGAREASWNASKSILGSAQSCNTDFGSNPVANASTLRIICMAKVRSELPDTEVRVKVQLVGLESKTPSYTPGNGLMVCTMHKANSPTNFFSSIFNSSTMKARLTTMIMTASVTPAIADAQEAPLPGSDWSFCDPNLPSG